MDSTCFQLWLGILRANVKWNTRFIPFLLFVHLFIYLLLSIAQKQFIVAFSIPFISFRVFFPSNWRSSRFNFTPTASYLYCILYSPCVYSMSICSPLNPDRRIHAEILHIFIYTERYPLHICNIHIYFHDSVWHMVRTRSLAVVFCYIK